MQSLHHIHQKQQLNNQPQSRCTSITFIIETMWPPLCQKFDLQALPTPTAVQKAGAALAVHFRIRLCDDIDVLQNTFFIILSSLILILSSEKLDITRNANDKEGADAIVSCLAPFLNPLQKGSGHQLANSWLCDISIQDSSSDQSDFFSHVTVTQLLVYATFGNGIFMFVLQRCCFSYYGGSN